MGMNLDDLQQNIDAERQSYFDKLHSAELANISKNFTSDEQIDICKVVSSKVIKEEYERRITVVDGIMDKLVAKMEQYNLGMDLIEKEEFIAEVRQIVRGEK